MKNHKIKSSYVSHGIKKIPRLVKNSHGTWSPAAKEEEPGVERRLEGVPPEIKNIITLTRMKQKIKTVKQ